MGRVPAATLAAWKHKRPIDHPNLLIRRWIFKMACGGVTTSRTTSIVTAGSATTTSSSTITTTSATARVVASILTHIFEELLPVRFNLSLILILNTFRD